MAGLLSLSNELLIAIYSYSPTIQTAVSFSRTNKRLRATWLEHGNRVITSVLEPQIPAYKDAVDLVVLETTLVDSTVVDPLPLRICLPRLMHNAKLAASAVTAWTTWLASLEPDNYRRHQNFTSPHASYYMMRKLHHARQHPEIDLLPALYTSLRACSLDTWDTHEELSWFLLSGAADYEVKLPHGIPKPKEEWTKDDEFIEERSGCVNTDEWDWVGDVLDCGIPRRDDGWEYLEKITFEDPSDWKAGRAFLLLPC